MTCIDKHMIRLVSVLLALWLLPVSSALGQTYRVTEMNTEQLRALDRNRTVVLLPGGILEEHGPYLPSFSDGYANERFTEELAEAISDRPGWNALVFPQIPLGSGGANEIGRKYVCLRLAGDGNRSKELGLYNFLGYDITHAWPTSARDRRATNATS